MKSILSGQSLGQLSWDGLGPLLANGGLVKVPSGSFKVTPPRGIRRYGAGILLQPLLPSQPAPGCRMCAAFYKDVS